MSIVVTHKSISAFICLVALCSALASELPRLPVPKPPKIQPPRKAPTRLKSSPDNFVRVTLFGTGKIMLGAEEVTRAQLLEKLAEIKRSGDVPRIVFCVDSECRYEDVREVTTELRRRGVEVVEQEPGRFVRVTLFGTGKIMLGAEEVTRAQLLEKLAEIKRSGDVPVVLLSIAGDCRYGDVYEVKENIRHSGFEVVEQEMTPPKPKDSGIYRPPTTGKKFDSKGKYNSSPTNRGSKPCAKPSKSTGADDTRENQDWIGKVSGDVYNKWTPPEGVFWNGAPPRATIELTIAADGRVLSSKLVKPSGNARMDASIKEMLCVLTRVTRPPHGGQTIRVELTTE